MRAPLQEIWKRDYLVVSERDQKPRGFVVRRLALNGLSLKDKRWLTKLQEHKVSLRVVAFIRDFCDIGSSDFHCSIGGSNFRIEIEIKVNDWNAKLKKINIKPSKNKQTNKESVSRRNGRSVSQSASQPVGQPVSLSCRQSPGLPATWWSRVRRSRIQLIHAS